MRGGVIIFGGFFLLAQLLSQPALGLTKKELDGVWIGNYTPDEPFAIDLEAAKSEGYHGSLDYRRGYLFWLRMMIPFSWKMQDDGTIGLYRNMDSDRHPMEELACNVRSLRSGELQFQGGGFMTEACFQEVKNIRFHHTDIAWINMIPGAPYDDFASQGYTPRLRNFPRALLDFAALLAIDDNNFTGWNVSDPAITPDILDVLADRIIHAAKYSGLDDEHHLLLTVIASNPHCSLKTLAALFAMNDPAVWLAAARNPKAPATYEKAALERVQKGDAKTRFYVARNKNALPDELAAAALPGEEEVFMQIAENPKAPGDLLAEIARRGGRMTRNVLTRNPSSPPEVLRELASTVDEDWAIAEIAVNPSTPKDVRQTVLSKMAVMHDATMRANVAANPAATEPTLDGLAGDPDACVRASVAGNPSCSRNSLEKLADDKYQTISADARNNLEKNFPADAGRLSVAWKPLDQLNPAAIGGLPRVNDPAAK